MRAALLLVVVVVTAASATVESANWDSQRSYLEQLLVSHLEQTGDSKTLVNKLCKLYFGENELCDELMNKVFIKLDSKSPTATEEGCQKECDECKQVVDQLKKKIQDPEVVKKMRDSVDKICKAIAMFYDEEECKKSLNESVDQAIAYVKDVKPLEFCQSVKLCPAN